MLEICHETDDQQELSKRDETQNAENQVFIEEHYLRVRLHLSRSVPHVLFVGKMGGR